MEEEVCGEVILWSLFVSYRLTACRTFLKYGEAPGTLLFSILAVVHWLRLALLSDLAELFEELCAVTRGFFGLACFLGQITLPRNLGALQRIRPSAQLPRYAFREGFQI